MKRTDLTEKPYKEIEEILQNELDAFKETVDKISDPEELLKLEEEIIEEFKEYDEYISNLEYELPNSCEYDNQKFTKNQIAIKIIYFLNKSEVEWSYTLGMYQLVQLWKQADLSKIAYKAYDSTLRCLNQVKFKGFEEWRDILAINEYMSACHENYSKDASWMHFLSSKHNIVMDRAKLTEAIPAIPEM